MSTKPPIDVDPDENFSDESAAADQVDNQAPPVVVAQVEPAKPEPTPQAGAAEPPKPSAKPAPIKMDDRGLVTPRDSDELMRVATGLINSRALPKVFQNAYQVWMALQFLKEHGIPSMIGLRQTTIINGVLSIWGDLPLAVVKRSTLLEEFDECLIDKDYNVISVANRNLSAKAWGAWCRVRRSSEKEITRSFTMDEAHVAGLLDKASSVWNSYPRRMLQMRARSLALKDGFADVLSGIAIAEYDFNELPDVSETKAPGLADELNAAYYDRGAEDGKEEGRVPVPGSEPVVEVRDGG
jgi:hypothetical protein